MSNYDWLFQERTIGSKTAPNLLVLHPLERSNGTPEGKPRESAFEWYRGLAGGRWGVLFVECTTCSDNPDDRGHSPNGFLMSESNRPEFERMVREVKEISPETLLMIQLSTGSVGSDSEGNGNAMRLSASEISRSLANMVRGSALAAEIGFDGMDFKICHGHLPYHLLAEENDRHDKWGGDTLRQRARFVIEVVNGIREELARRGKEDFVIGARISESNLLNLRDIVEVLDKDLGLDFISVSQWPDTFGADAIAILTQAVKMMAPKASVMQAAFTSYLARGGQPLEKMRQALLSRLAPDFVGFGRQAIADPLTPKKLRDGLSEEITWCKRCNGCGRSLHCKQYGEEQGWSEFSG